MLTIKLNNDCCNQDWNSRLFKSRKKSKGSTKICKIIWKWMDMQWANFIEMVEKLCREETEKNISICTTQRQYNKEQN